MGQVEYMGIAGKKLNILYGMNWIYLNHTFAYSSKTTDEPHFDGTS